MHKEEPKTVKILQRLMGDKSQSELSRDMKEAGQYVPQGTISRILKGQKPDLPTAEKFAAYFNISVPQFLGSEAWEQPHYSTYLTPRAIRLAKLYDSLSEDLQRAFFGIIANLTYKPETKPEKPEKAEKHERKEKKPVSRVRGH